MGGRVVWLEGLLETLSSQGMAWGDQQGTGDWCWPDAL